MSYGKMKDFLEIVSMQTGTDEDGFALTTEATVAKVRGYREVKHGNTEWANRASFSDATDLFRFRAVPNVEIRTGMFVLCDNHRFEITSVEDVKGRGMYIEVLGKEVIPSG